MVETNPRIHTALLSVNPTTQYPAWHGLPTPLGLLRGVSSSVAVWRPYPGANNIREIALHIAFWENSVANRLSGQKVLAGFKQRKTGWAKLLDAVDEAQWKSEITLVRVAHERLVQAVSAFDPTRLDLPAGKGTTRPAIEFIHGVAEHSLYHGAQIETLKKLASQFIGQDLP